MDRGGKEDGDPPPRPRPRSRSASRSRTGSSTPRGPTTRGNPSASSWSATRLVTEEQLFTALLRQEKEGRLIGVILVGDGAVSEDDLRRALQLKVGETIYDLFLWPEGQFEFKDGELPQPPGIPVDLPVMGVIMEGARRVDEWSRIRRCSRPRGRRSRCRRTFPPTSPTARNAGSSSSPRPGRTLAAIALETRRSEFDTAARAFDLHQRGLLAVAQVQDTLPVGRRHEPDPRAPEQGRRALRAEALRQARWRPTSRCSPSTG